MNNIVFYDPKDELVLATPPAQLVECFKEGVRALVTKPGTIIHNLGGGWLVDMQMVGVTRYFALVTNPRFDKLSQYDIQQKADVLFYHTPTTQLQTMIVTIVEQELQQS